MTELLAWVWAPVLIYVVSFGLGLLVDRALRLKLPPALLAPTGLAAAVVVTTLLYRLRLPAVVPPALILMGAGGLLWARSGLRRAVSAPGLVAGGLVYVLYMAPVVFSGEPTWAGYNFVNDTASNFVLTDYLAHHGVAAPVIDSGTTANAANLLTNGYPLGSFSLLAGFLPLTGVPLESVYQPFMASIAGLAAMSLMQIARSSGVRPSAAVAIAALPLGAVLLHRYVLHGAIKEIVLVQLSATAVALAGVAVQQRLVIRLAVAIAVVCVAMVTVYGVAAGAYVAGLLLATAGVVAAGPNRPSLGHVAKLLGLGSAVGLVLLLPVLGSALEFVPVVKDLFSASDGLTEGQLGQLLRPLPVTQAGGIWIGRDYRLPADAVPTINTVLVVIAIISALAGVGFALRARRLTPVVLLATMGLPALALSPQATPYIDAKLLVVLTPVVVFMGLFAAATALQSRGRFARGVGAAAFVAIGAGVLASDIFGYREARPAPLARMHALQDVAARVPDRRLYLFNEWEEFGKYFMRTKRVNPAGERESPRFLRLKVERGLPSDLPRASPRREPRLGRWFDLDEQTLPFLGSFGGLIMRRSPAASRPPATYRLLYRNAYYELWKRDRPVRVRGHYALQRSDRATSVPGCGRVRRLARIARPGDRLVAARPPRVTRLSPVTASRPSAWRVAQEPAGPEGSVIPFGPGTLRGLVAASGEQLVWIKASGGRAITVSVNGQVVGTTRQIDTPGQWQLLGRIRLSARPTSRTITVSRGGATLRPNDAQRGFIGPVALQSARPGRLVAVAPRDAARLCGRAWDWIELVGAKT